VLSANGKSVSTVEHLLAAIFSYKITHIVCEVKGGEIPIMDGSALPFAKMIAEVGIKDLDRMVDLRRFNSFHLKKENTEIFYMPSDDIYVFAQISYDIPYLEYQYNGCFIKRYQFADRIAPARTFALKEWIPKLKEEGLIKGGSPSNALIIDRKAKPPNMRFKDEPVRHKILDFLGDLCLLGPNIIGKFFLINTGHTDHIKFLRLLEKEEIK